MTSLCAGASVGRPGAVNQDAWFVDTSSGFAVFAVADGVGSHPHSEIASQAVIAALANASKNSHASVEDRVTDARATVTVAAAEFCGSRAMSIPVANAFSTTLVLACEQQHQLSFAWLGNGAILHMHGGALLSPSRVPLPWQLANHLVPHVERSPEGRSALSRYISGSTSHRPQPPSILSIKLDIDGPGDVFIICTDGICSFDEQAVGKISDGTYWQRLDAPLLSLIALLRRITIEPGELDAIGLKTSLQHELDELANTKALSDDATAIVFLSDQFLVARRTRGDKLAA